MPKAYENPQLTDYGHARRQLISDHSAHVSSMLAGHVGNTAAVHPHGLQNNASASRLQIKNHHPWPPPLPAEIFYQACPPYLSGSPNPPYLFKSPGSTNKTDDVSAWGDPLTGNLSVHISAGDIIWGGFGTAVGGNVYHADMPGRWLFGDSIDSRASIISVIPTTQNNETLVTADTKQVCVSVEYSWDVEDADKHDKPVDWGLEYAVGKETSPHSGLLGMAVDFSLTLSTLSKHGAVLDKTLAPANILSLIVDATHPGNVQAKGDLPTVHFEWFFRESSKKTFTLSATIPFHKDVAHIVAEPDAYLFGGRASIGNKDAGWVGGTFSARNLCEGSLVMPFVVNNITAYALK